MTRHRQRRRSPAVELSQAARRPPAPGEPDGDVTLPLGQVAEGYGAMDERRAINGLLLP